MNAWRLEEMQLQLDQAVQDREEAESKAKEAQEKAITALSRLAAVQQQDESMQDALDRATSERDELLERLGDMEIALDAECKERRMLQGELASMRHTLAAVEEDLASAREEAQTAVEREKVATREAAAAEDERNKTLQEHKALKVQYRESCTAALQLQKQAEEMERALTRAVRQANDVAQEKDHLSTSFEATQTELNAVRDRLRGEETLRRLDARELQQLRSSTQELTTTCSDQRIKLRKVESERERLVADLLQRTSDLDATRGRAEASEATCRSLESSLQELESLLAQADRSVQIAESQAASLKTRLEASQVELARFQGDENALKESSIAELEALMGVFERVAPLVRAAMLHAKEREVHEAQQCFVCLNRRRDTALSCGHVLCSQCATQVDQCPVCRAPVLSRTRVWW